MIQIIIHERRLPDACGGQGGVGVCAGQGGGETCDEVAGVNEVAAGQAFQVGPIDIIRKEGDARSKWDWVALGCAMIIAAALAGAGAVYFTKQELDTTISPTQSNSSKTMTTRTGVAEPALQSSKIETARTTAQSL